MKLKAMVNALLSSIYPPNCLFCGKPIEPFESCCRMCERTILPNLSKGTTQLSAQFSLPFLAAYDYEDAVKHAIHNLKFYDRKQNGAAIGCLMAECSALRDFIAGADCITAAPLSRKRLADRGYNQSELIGKALSEKVGIPYENFLEKHIDNVEQSSLSRKERLENVVGVYRMAKKADVKGRHIVLVDDIITTGATLYACAAVLLEAGAESVRAVAFAHSKLS